MRSSSSAASCSTSCPQASSRSATSDCSPTATGSQALALCRLHLHATTPDISALLTEPQKSALNRSCPQCKRGTLHVVARPLLRWNGQLPRTARLRALRLILRKIMPHAAYQPDPSHRQAFIPPTLPHGLESAPHNLDACRSLAIHTADAPLNGPAQVTGIPFRAQSAASAHRKQLSIPILLPR